MLSLPISDLTVLQTVTQPAHSFQRGCHSMPAYSGRQLTISRTKIKSKLKDPAQRFEIFHCKILHSIQNCWDQQYHYATTANQNEPDVQREVWLQTLTRQANPPTTHSSRAVGLKIPAVQLQRQVQIIL